MFCLEVELYKTQRRCKPTRYRYMMQDIQRILIQSENIKGLISAAGYTVFISSETAALTLFIPGFLGVQKPGGGVQSTTPP